MPKRIGPQDFDLKIRFGGGLHTRASEEDIDAIEAADGQNFLLDLDTKELRPRAPFDLIGTVPNHSEIRGGGSFLKSDGTIFAFIQAGNTVYKWDGGNLSTPTVLGNVNSSAKLRCDWRRQSWTLDNLGIITDLGLLEVVKSWNGTTWQDIAFKSGPSTSFGSFYAKYCNIEDERALFAHVRDTNGTLPHMLVGSLQSDYTRIDVTNKPSSALAEDDPFFMLTPDLKPINGFVSAFRTNLISTEKGKMFNLSGQSAQDFNFEDFYPGSGASGEESVAYVGNDVIYGRQGRVESVRNLTQFGDSEADDITRQVSDSIRSYTGWRTFYNGRLNRVYLFPINQSEVWVYNTSMGSGNVSPWMRWRTNHPLAFQPTFTGSMLDPSDGLEYVFMGDSAGNFYRMEGTGSSGDGGNSNITTSYTTKMFSAPLDAEAYKIEGYLKYRKNVAATVGLTFEFAGEANFNQEITVSIPAVTGRHYFGSGLHFHDGTHFGTISGRLVRQKFLPPGQASDFQIKVNIEGIADFSITEIGLRFTAASN